MYPPDQIVRLLFDAFDKASGPAWRQFMAARPGATKWMIVSDYCLHDPSRPEDVMAFSIIPYDDWLPNIQARIRSAMPRDIKHTQTIAQATVEYLKHPGLFHVAFILDSGRSFFTHGPGSNPLIIARESIQMDLAYAVEKERGPERINRLKALRQASQANSFNVGLLSDLVILSILYSFLSLLLARDSKPELISWISDRDSLTTFNERILWDHALETVHGVAEQLGIPLQAVQFPIAAPDPTKPADEGLWYDDLIRVADYFAGTIAAWDVKANAVPKEKFARMLRDVIADSPRVLILRLRIGDEGLQVSQRQVTSTRTLPLPN